MGDYEVKSIRSQMEIEKMKILIESKDSVLAETLAELCLEREKPKLASNGLTPEEVEFFGLVG